MIQIKSKRERMLQTNSLNDPLVEILRLAYRRGLAILEEQRGRTEAFSGESREEDILTEGSDVCSPEVQATEKVKGGT